VTQWGAMKCTIVHEEHTAKSIEESIVIVVCSVSLVWIQVVLCMLIGVSVFSPFSCFVVCRVDGVAVWFVDLSIGIRVEIGHVQSSWLWRTCYCLPMNIDPVL